jgi:hypothetical protein
LQSKERSSRDAPVRQIGPVPTQEIDMHFRITGLPSEQFTPLF